MQLSTLVFLFRTVESKRELLMIHKRRGQGAGLWNVPGGKNLEGELPTEAASRECVEETGLKPLHLESRGWLRFCFLSKDLGWSNCASVFVSNEYQGELCGPNEECEPKWVRVDQIPWNAMWEADRFWMPLVLRNKQVQWDVVFGKSQLVLETRAHFMKQDLETERSQ